MVCVGRRILPKCEIHDEAEDCLSLLSGRAHRVYTGLTLVTPIGGQRSRLVETRVRFKRLSRAEMNAYLASGEWRGKAGGYAIQGLAGAFVLRLVGSYTSVVGLPLAEAAGLLAGEGYPVHRSLDAGRLSRWRGRQTSARRRKRRAATDRQACVDLRQAARPALRSVLLEALRRRRPPPLVQAALMSSPAASRRRRRARTRQ